MTALEEASRKLAEMIRKASRVLAFTGAGISTESGISDYRSQGGVWQRFQPVTLQDFLASEEKRREYWRQKKELYAQLELARPNEGHVALAELARMGKLLGVVTQNIDELHQMAGMGDAEVLELHGTNRKTVCLDCGAHTDWRETYRRLLEGEEILRCRKCGGLLKPATISFGQTLDPEVLRKAEAWASSCNLFLAVGSTLVVEPAASLPALARQRGARFALINLSETPFDDFADLVIRAQAGSVLAKTVEMLRHPMA
jgi:NAD-dependent deacetylase